MSFLEIFILSLIEGITEFLPISSTGHLIIANSILKINPTDFTKAFDVIIQFGAILAVVILYKERLRWNFSYYKKILFAFLPTAILGFLLKSKIDLLMDSTTVVAVSLILGGVLLIFIESLFANGKNEEVLSDKNAFLVGLIQSISMIPGVSRSAATIIGARSFGLSREKAAEFSFILAIPTLTAATLYKLWKIRNILELSSISTLGTGVVLSFIFSVFAIKFFIAFINKYGFRFFGYYRIVIGLIVLISSYFGVL